MFIRCAKKLPFLIAILLVAGILTISNSGAAPGNISAAAAGNVVKVTAVSGLNLRTGPGTQYSVIKVLENGSRWYTFGSSNGWLKLGTNKWIYSGYTKASSPIATVITTAQSGLNVRTGPGTAYKALRILPYNTEIDVLEQKNGWLKVGNDEWISGTYTRSKTGLSNVRLGWYYIPNSTHTVPKTDTTVDIAKYSGYYTGDISSKTIYLSFDLGYEGGYTSRILTTLMNNNVKASFFVTGSYITNQPTLVKRMINEGHTVGNHTKAHISQPEIAYDPTAYNNEILSVEASFKTVTGKDMLKILRPPYGDYSELSLYMNKQLGYKSIFWSFAYYDYDVSQPPDKTYAFNKITGGTHNGAILLLHATNSTNADILDSVIKNIREQGYQFNTLDTLQ